MNELPRVMLWIRTLLEEDDDLYDLLRVRVPGDRDAARKRIHSHKIPVGSKFPVVVFQYRPGAKDIKGVGAVRILTRSSWLIKAVGQTDSFDDVEPIADRIDFLFDRSEGKAGESMYVLSCTRKDLFAQEEQAKNVDFRHLGATYEIDIQPRLP